MRHFVQIVFVSPGNLIKCNCSEFIVCLKHVFYDLVGFYLFVEITAIMKFWQKLKCKHSYKCGSVNGIVSITYTLDFQLWVHVSVVSGNGFTTLVCKFDFLKLLKYILINSKLNK